MIMLNISVQTDINRFARDLKTYTTKIEPKTRRCLHQKMVERGREAAIKTAQRLTKNVARTELETIIRSEVAASGQFRRANGQFGSAAAQITLRRIKGNRTSQVLRMMVVGGRVRINSPEMEGMTIAEGVNVDTARRILVQTIRTGKLIISEASGTKTWYGRKLGNSNYTVVSNRKGLTLFKRSGRYHRAIRRSGSTGGNRASVFVAFLPKRATFKKNQFPFSSVVIRAIREGFVRDQDACFRTAARQLVGRSRNIRGSV